MAEDNKKGITVKVDADLHAQIKEYIESRGMTMGDFITAACDDFLHPKIQEKEEKQVENMRTVAFQVPESLFQRIKDYLHRNNMTQRQFLLGLIENELERDQTQREAAVEPVSAESEKADEVTEQTAETAVVSSVPTVWETEEERTEQQAEDAPKAEESMEAENTEFAEDTPFEETDEEFIEESDEDSAEDAVNAQEETLEISQSDDHIIDAAFAQWDAQGEDQEESEVEAEEEEQDYGMMM